MQSPPPQFMYVTVFSLPESYQMPSPMFVTFVDMVKLGRPTPFTSNPNPNQALSLNSSSVLSNKKGNGVSDRRSIGTPLRVTTKGPSLGLADGLSDGCNDSNPNGTPDGTPDGIPDAV